MEVSKAIQEGIDAARFNRKDALSPYHECHPLFRYWWEACVLKSDIPSLDDKTIKKTIVNKLKLQKIHNR